MAKKKKTTEPVVHSVNEQVAEQTTESTTKSTTEKVYYTIKKTSGFENKHLVESEDGFEPCTIQCAEYGIDPDKKYKWITESQLNG